MATTKPIDTSKIGSPINSTPLIGGAIPKINTTATNQTAKVGAGAVAGMPQPATNMGNVLTPQAPMTPANPIAPALSNTKVATPAPQKTAAQPAVKPSTTTKTTTTPTATKTTTDTPVNQKISDAWNSKTLAEQQALVKANPDMAKYMNQYGLKYATDNTVKPQTEEVKQETPAAGKPDYQDNSPERLAEINTNLENAYKTTPNLFTDITAFDKAFDYNARSPEQKKILDNFYANKKQQTQYNGMTPAQIGDLYKAGNFDLTYVDGLQNTDPARYTAIKAAIDAANTSIANQGTIDTLNGTTSAVTTNATSAVAAADAAFKAYTDAMNSDEAKGFTDTINTKNGEIDQIDLDIAKIKDEIEAEYKDKGISKSLLNSIITDRTQSYIDQKNSKLIEVNTATNQLNAITKRAKDTYDAQTIRNEAMQTDFNNNLALFKTQYGIQQDERAYQLELQKLEAGKYAAVSDGMGGVTVYNTKTGEITNNSGGMTSSQITEYQDAGGNFINVPRTGNNVGADTNNFGNITSAVSGAIGMYKSPNGRSYAVFANAQDGYNALVNDLKAKQSGNTKTGLNGNSTIEELMGTWVNGKGKVDTNSGYYKAFLAASGLKPGQTIGSASVDALARGVMGGEGTLKAYEAGGKDLSSYKSAIISPTTSTYSPGQMALMDKIDISKPDGIKLLRSQGLTTDDYANYKASKALNNTDYSSALASLSPLARSIAMGKASLSDISGSGTSRKQIQDELAASGIDGFGMGDQDFWMLKGEDKKGLAQFLQTQDRFAKIQTLLDKGTDTGIDENVWNWISGTLGIGTQDVNFNQLKQAAGKELVSFIKSISGTAVSENERRMLMDLLPSAGQQISSFKDSFQSALREYNAQLASKAYLYGFDSVEAMRTAIGMSAQPDSSTNADANSYINTYTNMINTPKYGDALSSLGF